MNTEIKFNAAPKSGLWSLLGQQLLMCIGCPWQIHLKSVHQCFQGARSFEQGAQWMYIRSHCATVGRMTTKSMQSTGLLGCFYVQKLFQLSCHIGVVKRGISWPEPYLVVQISSISRFFSNGAVIRQSIMQSLKFISALTEFWIQLSLNFLAVFDIDKNK